MDTLCCQICYEDVGEILPCLHRCCSSCKLTDELGRCPVESSCLGEAALSRDQAYDILAAIPLLTEILEDELKSSGHTWRVPYIPDAEPSMVLAEYPLNHKQRLRLINRGETYEELNTLVIQHGDSFTSSITPFTKLSESTIPDFGLPKKVVQVTDHSAIYIKIVGALQTVIYDQDNRVLLYGKEDRFTELSTYTFTDNSETFQLRLGGRPAMLKRDGYYVADYCEILAKLIQTLMDKAERALDAPINPNKRTLRTVNLPKEKIRSYLGSLGYRTHCFRLMVTEPSSRSCYRFFNKQVYRKVMVLGVTYWVEFADKTLTVGKCVREEAIGFTTYIEIQTGETTTCMLCY